MPHTHLKKVVAIGGLMRNSFIAFGLLACGSGAVLIPSPSQAQTSEYKRSYNIPSQRLDLALNSFAQQSRVQIMFDPELVSRLRSVTLRGSFVPSDGLRKLLNNTGLVAEQNASGIYLIRSRHSGNHEGQTPSVSAQSSDGDDVAQSTEDIVVTAQKRSERLIETPQSVSVISGASLASSGATQFRDFADTVPGLTFQSAGVGQTQITLRGVTAGFDLGPLVGVYVDEVPYGSSSSQAKASQLALDSGLFDVDRIEVLRGPQGTLYGASAMGGIIKYITTAPSLANIEGELRAGVTDTRDGGLGYDAAAVINIPVVEDRVAVRASGFYSRDGGYIDDVGLGRTDVNRSSVYGARLQVLAKFTPRLSVLFAGNFQTIARDGTATADFNYSGLPVDGDLQQRRRVREPFDQKFQLASMTLKNDFDFANLTAISSYQYVDSKSVQDNSSVFAPILNSIPLGYDYYGVGVYQFQSTKKFTQEVRLASLPGTDLEWLVGGFYTHEKSSNRQGFSPLIDPLGVPIPNNLLTYSGPSTYSEAAGFADVTYHFTPKFDVSGGIRYARNRQRYQQIGSGLLIDTRPEGRSSESVLTYLANARYRMSRNATAYARFATGYRPGGPNAVIYDQATGRPVAPPTFRSDKLKSYELGFKATTEDGTFGVDAAAYHIDWKGIQVLTTAGGLSVTTNASGGARIDGSEVTFTLRPVPNFLTTIGLAYQNARLSGASPEIGASKGERLPNVPKFTVAWTSDYTVSGSALKPKFGATVRLVSDRLSSFSGNTTSRLYHLPSYASLDLRASIQVGDIGLRIFARNVTDERAQISSLFLTTTPPVPISMLQPRTIGASATAHF